VNDNSASGSRTESEEALAGDPLARFRNWRGFLAATVLLNALFVYGLMAGTPDPTTKLLFKMLSWLPFNLIATALYYVFMVKLARAETGTHFYGVLCSVMIVANWLIMIAA
jgi:hypothetical protein